MSFKKALKFIAAAGWTKRQHLQIFAISSSTAAKDYTVSSCLFTSSPPIVSARRKSATRIAATKFQPHVFWPPSWKFVFISVA
jgi:hypothetical protein